MQRIQHYLKRLPLVNANLLIALTALLIASGDNLAFWKQTLDAIDLGGGRHLLFVLAVASLQFALVYVLLSLFSFRPLLKPVLFIAIVISAFTGYFMDAFGTVIDPSMIQNAMETDSAEAGDLISASLLGHVFLFGILPGLMIVSLRVRRQSWKKALQSRLLALTLVMGVTSVLSYFAYRDISFIFREHKQLTYMINPVFPLRSLVKYYRDQQPAEPEQLQVVFGDAHRDARFNTRARKSVFVVVIGETARAENFHINGYTRDTTPELERHKIYNFSDTSSCGTSTAISVPCIFSLLDHDHYNDSARNSENVLDALKRAGIDVFWRENNSGCKGVCQRITTQTMVQLHPQDFCNEEGCFDEVLLYKLQDYLDNLENDTVIVLHQQGSHGPSYYKRYPDRFARFQPACDKADVQNCSYQQIVNAYDNSILYTDHVLGQVIDLLKANSDHLDTGMLYVSDHGESLGENGVYLHGLPYLFAPRQQTHVPMVMWLSDGFTRSRQIDTRCLAQQQDHAWSHDNILHTLLGASGVVTERYNPNMDILDTCYQQGQIAAQPNPGPTDSQPL